MDDKAEKELVAEAEKTEAEGKEAEGEDSKVSLYWRGAIEIAILYACFRCPNRNRASCRKKWVKLAKIRN
mgnify:CR=1 FL=1